MKISTSKKNFQRRKNLKEAAAKNTET